MKDALGNDIEIGKVYGYSMRNNGIVKIVVGEVISLFDDGEKAKLKVLNRGKAIYSDDVTAETTSSRKTVNIITNTLFKLESNYNVTWESNE